MRRVKEIKTEVLSRRGRYTEVYPEGATSKDPSPLKVKQVVVNDRRYIVCLNTRQARKEAADRQAIIEALKVQLKKGAKSLVGNKGYRRYLKMTKDSAASTPTKSFEWSDIKQDLKALQLVTVEEESKRFAIRSQCQGNCGKIFQAVKVALPPTIREIT